MKNFHYKGYFVFFDRNHNGSIVAHADSDQDRFNIVFYDYSLTEIYKRMKKQCSYRLDNGIFEGYGFGRVYK